MGIIAARGARVAQFVQFLSHGAAYPHGIVRVGLNPLVLVVDAAAQ